mmetsp:Transcript_11621/g.25117  ORF Transcript_11621/g.25117 Transcript_11621/m.25117 type:complete len:119 (-) Transcript_11621:191-547(-)
MRGSNETDTIDAALVFISEQRAQLEQKWSEQENRELTLAPVVTAADVEHVRKSIQLKIKTLKSLSLPPPPPPPGDDEHETEQQASTDDTLDHLELDPDVDPDQQHQSSSADSGGKDEL